MTFFYFAVVQLDMSVNIVNIQTHVIQVQDQDVKMEEFVKLIIQHQCLVLNVDARLVLQLLYVRFLSKMHVIQDHVKMVDHVT